MWSGFGSTSQNQTPSLFGNQQQQQQPQTTQFGVAQPQQSTGSKLVFFSKR